MCGLLGLLGADCLDEATIAEVQAAADLMHHRGPDELGSWHHGPLAYVFNRLSFIDIDHAHQPLHWSVGDQVDRYSLVFNGEIYNYVELRAELEALGAVFTTEGDGETIAAGWHYWGKGVLHRLRGMFAFALWDAVEASLVVARDPFGIKPLFLATSAAGTVFGSEKKCLLSVADRLGLATTTPPRVVQHYTQFQYVPEPASLHEGISKLESGCFAIIKPGENPQIERYFWPTFTPVFEPENTVFHNIADALIDSVAVHMRADVTVGSFLSGGIDSTAIAALAVRSNPDLKTFTVGFDRQGYSEIDVARQSAQAIGVAHDATVVDQEEFIAAIAQIVWYLDDPVADPSLVPLYFLAQKARESVKVVLSGEGSDELFGGYTIYQEPLSLRYFNHVPGVVKAVAAKAAGALPDGVKGKSFVLRGTASMEQRYWGNARNFSDAQLKRVLVHYDSAWCAPDVTGEYYAHSRGWDPVARMQYVDLFTWLRGDILVKADKITMAHSLELRVPFLDARMWEVARTLTVAHKISHGTTKYALRKALELIVPAHVVNRPKLGFPVPLKYWLRDEPMFTWARDIVRSSNTGEFFHSHEVLAMLEEHRQGESDHSRRLWTILLFMVWHQIFVEKTLVPQINKKSYPVRL